MATPTVTPDVTLAPEPAPAAPSGTLASILAPVEPARPVKTIGSTASMAEESINDTVGGTAAKTPKNSGPVREHPIGALVRAIATRLARPSTSNHVKRQHTITESRVSGGSNTTTHAKRSSQDGKNHQVGQHRTARDAKLADNRSKLQQHQGRDQRDVRSADTRASTSASRNGRDVKDHKDAKSAGTTTASKQDAVHKTHRDGLDSRPGKTADATTKKGQTAAAADTSTKNTTPAPKDATAAKDQTATAKETKTGSDTTTKTSTGETTTAEKAATDTKTPPAPRPRTQSSREAGYHDGTRAAKVTNQVKAYRDGVQDGYADGTAEYEREKRRMDDAKARNATKPDKPAKPAKQPASGSTADLAKKQAPADTKPANPTPELVQLTGISETTIAFDADGASHTMSRREVRTLKGFERRMAAKRPVLQKAAEASKATRAKAADHALRAQRLAEAAKSVEGGDRLVAKLQRLAEATHNLRAKTEDIEKRAHRGTEAVSVAVANANTRHGGIYKAVADSPLTKPAEREFYQDKEGS